jgi:para-nitrobenzyl esterase
VRRHCGPRIGVTGTWVGALAAAALLTTSCAIAEPAGTRVGDRTLVEQGELQGSPDGGVLRFQGIPYAAPPVGELRWAPPQPPARWSETWQATVPGARCAQLAAPAGTPHATEASHAEDCLTLNVTLPGDATHEARLPVLVWLHGGGFNAGAGSDVDARRLAADGRLVVVTVNYRLGIFGFLGLPGLEGSGNFGLLDQQAALRWVQHNIAAFGGNPQNVTLAGESAGADSVCAQLAAPSSVGLFSKVILQSGGCGTANIIDVIRPGTGPGGDTWKPQSLAESAGITAAGKLGCGDPATVLACLRALPAAQIVNGVGTYWSPAVGTNLLPRRPSDAAAASEFPAVPMLAGTTRDEGTLFTTAFFNRAAGPLTVEGFRSKLSTASGSKAAQAGGAYRMRDRSPGRVWSDVITDRAYACPGLAMYRLVGGRAPLYAYEFADPTAPSPFVALPPDLTGGTTHGSELAYLFDLVPGQPAFTQQQQALAEQLVTSWAKFASTGDPNGGRIAWPRWKGFGQILAITGATNTTTMSAADFSTMHHCELWGS